jgi:hypothetical protein
MSVIHRIYAFFDLLGGIRLQLLMLWCLNYVLHWWLCIPDKNRTNAFAVRIYLNHIYFRETNYSLVWRNLHHGHQRTAYVTLNTILIRRRVMINETLKYFNMWKGTSVNIVYRMINAFMCRKKIIAWNPEPTTCYSRTFNSYSSYSQFVYRIFGRTMNVVV